MSSLNIFNYLENDLILINNLLNLSPLTDISEPELLLDKLSNEVDKDILYYYNIITSVPEEAVRKKKYIYTKYN